MRYVLGVDGGGTKTHALVSQENGQILGHGEGATSNHQVSGLHAAIAEIRKAVESALYMSKLLPGNIEIGFYCLAGADLPEDFQMLEKAIGELALSKTIRIKNDTFAALRSGLTRPSGVVVVCGTGFNAAGIAPNGRELVLPGLGAISGDRGGGGAISMEIIRSVMRAWDGRGEKTLLTDLVLNALNLESIEILLEKLYHQEIKHHDLLVLVPLLFDAAEKDDEVARNLIIAVGKEVGITARALIRRLGLQNRRSEVVLAGSVFKGKGSLLLDTVGDTLHTEFPDVSIKRPRFEPVVGALLLAIETLDIDINKDIYGKMESSLPEKFLLSNS